MDMDVIILNSNFRRVLAVDYSTEFIWNRSFFGDGSCEIHSPVTSDLLLYAKKGNYIIRADDPMVCEITYVELQENLDEADSLIIKGTDITKTILNKRIIWLNFIYSGAMIGLVKKLIDDNFGTNAIADRRIYAADNTPMINVVSVSGVASEPLTFKSQNEQIGECLQQICQVYNYGFLLTLNISDSHVVHFDLRIYAPENKSATVQFSYENDNLLTTNFTSEFTSSPNIALVAGEIGETSRKYQSVGSPVSGLERTETFVDAQSLSSSLDWKDVFQSYPPKKKVYDFPYDPVYGGYMEPFQTKVDGEMVTMYYYIMGAFKIAIEDVGHLTVLKKIFKSYDWWLENDTDSGVTTFNVNNAKIAVFSYDAIANPPEKDPENEGTYLDEPEVIALDVLYLSMMMTTGYQSLCDFGGTYAFSGEINPNVMYTYKKHYNVGDYVMVSNKYGIDAVAQITAITETMDASGYHVDATIEQVTSKDEREILEVICTEDVTPIATEAGVIITM